MKAQALQGLSVLEVGHMVAAPFCAKLFADLGADVVKVETPRGGDPARRRSPFPDDVPHPERSGLFLYLNTSKRSVTLDLETEGGRRLFGRLAESADVVIEDVAPADRERLGVDHAALARTNPRLIVTSITPFGLSGPHRDYRTHHLNVYHASPHMAFSFGDPDGEPRAPVKAGRYLAEYDAGLTAALGTMAAVIARLGTGRGQPVEVSKQEAQMCIERVDIGRMINNPNPEPWRGSVGGLLRCKDGYLIITPVQNHQWEGLVRAMGDPDWAHSDLCRDETGRQENRERIQPYIDEWAAGLTRDEIYHRLQAEGTPAGPVRTVAEVREWGQARARGFFAALGHPAAGEQAYPTAPYHLSGERVEPTRAPLLGEHNLEVYCERLGYTHRDLGRLAGAGVI